MSKKKEVLNSILEEKREVEYISPEAIEQLQDLAKDVDPTYVEQLAEDIKKKPSDIVPEIQTETSVISSSTIQELQKLNENLSKEETAEIIKNGWDDEPVVIQPGPEDLKKQLLKDLIIKKEKPELPKTNIMNTAKRNVVPVNAPSDGALDIRGYSFKLRPDRPIKN